MTASWSPSPLIPPFRFGTVENEVYRGAYPKQRNLRYLKRLRLKTILSLIPDAPDPVFQQFCKEHGIQAIHLPVDKVKDNVPLTYNRAVEAVQVMIDPENLPIYVHCLDGASVTGLVVCCLRKLQTWNISSAMGEFLRFLRGGVISSEESVFVEKFASEIEIAKPIPPWLWEGQITFKKHPTLKLKISIPPTATSSTSTGRGEGPGSGVISSTLSLSPSMQSTSMTFPGDINNLANSGAHTNGSSSGTGHSSLNRIGKSIRDRSTSGSTNNGAINGVLSTSNPLLKSVIRTDMSGSGLGSRPTTIATPTTASLARNKRTMGSAAGGPTGLQSQIQNPSNFESLGGGPSGLGVRLHEGSGTNTSSPSSTGASGNTSAVISIAGEGSGSDHQHHHHQHRRKESVHILTKESKAQYQDDVESAFSLTPSDRPSVSKSPVPTQAVPVPEVIDEFYEVSMTLKALALEGADW
ncbi:hypothetical protein BG006_004070 [Podila minutissima]|uniref:Uncharacterized protein n=1 Tax=Podila minutissima TaxID=64525 RepID=A0A9P5VN07_9FUNG|nr:hypothetical protein BG006_004070 [Podila minutissima]